MGLFSGIKINPIKTVSNIFSGGDKLKGELNNASRNFSPLHRYVVEPLMEKNPKAPDPGENPQVTALRNKLFGEAQDFEGGLKGYQDSASNQIQREGDLALESGLRGTKQNFNRRGLLYSGLREAGEQGVKGKVASTMASQKAQSNKELTDMAQAKYTKAAQVGLQGYQDAVNREAEIAGINLQNQVARAQMMQALGQTGGQIGGSMYANRQGTPDYTGAWSSGPQQDNYTYGQPYRSGSF